MEMTEAQYRLIEHCLPRQRGNVGVSNRQVLNAIVYVAEVGCHWRSLPKRFGNWHTIYTRMNRWSKRGVLDRVFAQLQHERIVRVRIVVDGTNRKKAPEAPQALKHAARRSSSTPAADGPQRFIWLPRMLARL